MREIGAVTVGERPSRVWWPWSALLVAGLTGLIARSGRRHITVGHGLGCRRLRPLSTRWRRALLRPLPAAAGGRAASPAASQAPSDWRVRCAPGTRLHAGGAG